MLATINTITFKWALIGFFALVLFAEPRLAAGADVKGKASVIDGDTIRIDGVDIGLYGIDAPEMKQTCKTHKGKIQQCGELSRQTLEGLIRGRQVTCKDLRDDADGNPAAACFIGPISINEHMVADGWAVADPRAGHEFDRAETFAKARNEGIWRTEFLFPWEWRLKN